MDEFHANGMDFSETRLNSLHFTYFFLLWNILHISTNNNRLGLFLVHGRRFTIDFATLNCSGRPKSILLSFNNLQLGLACHSPVRTCCVQLPAHETGWIPCVLRRCNFFGELGIRTVGAYATHQIKIRCLKIRFETNDSALYPRRPST